MFHANPNQKCGFDQPDTSLQFLNKYFETTNVQGKNQLIRWKSVQVGATDLVYAQLDSANSNITFFDQNEMQLTPQTGSNDTLKILMITGQTPEIPQYVVAKLQINDTTTQIVGKLNVVSYNEIQKTLHFVPVNKNILPYSLIINAVTDSLNKIYGQAVVHWQADIQQPIVFGYSDADNNETFDAYPPDQVKFTPDMQALIDYYKANYTFNENDNYVFMPASEAPRYFPANMYYSYANAYYDESSFESAIIAHEIGHLYGLNHVFEYTNLMSYHQNSTKLIFRYKTLILDLANIPNIIDHNSENQFETVNRDLKNK